MSNYDEGERLKADAVDLVAAHREAEIRRIQRRFLTELLAKGESTTDAVSDATPAAIRRACLGAAANHLARAGLIEFVQFTISTRPDRHACPIRLWRLADREAAEKWLVDHPDLSGPAVVGQGGGEQGKLFDTAPEYE